MKIPLLYQDDDIIVVDKPAGLPTHAADPRDPYPGDVLRIVQGQLDQNYLGMHQRLDAETSGVLLFSARPEANRALAIAFEGRAVRKSYLALVHGRPRQREGLIDAALARDRDGRYRVTFVGDARGAAARTRYRVVKTSSIERQIFSLLEITPETGRTHQIRVHLSHIGHPVVGDPLYGMAGAIAPRLFLHAHQLTLLHPATAESVTFTAPPPPAFTRFMARAAIPVFDHIRQAVVRDPAAVYELLALALERRTPLVADPGITFYRIVNGTGDGLPGLTADRCGDGLVVSLYDGDDVLPPRPLPAALVEMLGEMVQPRAIYVKYRPRTASRIPADQMALLAPPQPIYGEAVEDGFLALEEGLKYWIRPQEGLSVGLFADMREGRARVRTWATGRTVLNCFAYTCGFGVAAMAGGAARVLNLDLSRSVLDWGQENYRRNGFSPDPHDFVFGDVFDWLARLARRGDRFDFVILDPPGFSRTKTGRFSVAQNYDDLLALAARVTTPGGRILACSNVAEQPWRAFRDLLLKGAASAGRRAEVAGSHHEPALDFPTHGEPYLKLALLQLN